VSVADLGLDQADPEAERTTDLRPLAAAIIVRDGRVLLTERRFPGHGEQWSWPSGKVEVNESLEDAILRELHEELLITEAEVVGHVGDIDLPSGFRMSHFHVAIPATAEPKLNDYEQLVRTQWMTRDEAVDAFKSLPPEIAREGIALLDRVLSGRPPAPSGPDPDLPQDRPSVAACYVVRNGRLLMVRRVKQEGGLEWAAPSGQIEPGESPEAAAVREVREELGVSIAVERRLGDRVHPATGRHLIYLACRITSGAPALVADDEITAIEWCDLATVKQRWANLKGGIFPPVLAYLEETMPGLEPSGPQATTDAGPAVASAIIVQDGRVLMTRRRRSQGSLLWNFVTGNVEPGETLEQAAVREVQEEVGLFVAVEQKLGERVHPASGRHMTYFACRIVMGKADLVDHEENAEVRWATLAEAAELLVPTGGIWEPVLSYLERAGVEAGKGMESLAEAKASRAAQRRSWAEQSKASSPPTSPSGDQPRRPSRRP
jgi:8-oxo-dGTP diphosphatase